MKSTSTNLITFEAELTDTFGGEANYTWVHRATFTAPANSDNKTVIAKAKAALGIRETARVRPLFHGDSWELRFPRGACMVAFVTARH